MKGQAEKLLRFMDGTQKRFVIPVYQRNYDWKRENCERLFDDLVALVRENRRSHFFGSIVSVTDDGRDFLIIDGQQRLTTVSLLFLAMYHLIDREKVVPAAPRLKDRIYNVYLVDEYAHEEKRLKLKPVKNDCLAFEKLFDDEEIPFSNLTQNYKYFYERILKQEVSVDDLFSAIDKLEIINITLEHDDDPQLIFESLNSTGLDLTEGDKIRNFVLMGRDPETQEKFYEKYWNEIEKSTDYNVTDFIRDYLQMKRQAFVKRDNIYLEFKRFSNNCANEEQLRDLLHYAKFYQYLIKGNFGDKIIDNCIYHFNYLDTTTCRGFLLKMLALEDEDVLTREELREIFLIIESFVFRRAICQLPTNALNKIFSSLHAEIERYENNTRNYFEKFKYALLEKTNTNWFPRDRDFLEKLTKRPLYLESKKKWLTYVLERFENFGTREDKNVFEHFERGEYSIEHIMPQTLSEAWKKELGDDWQNIYDNWCHTLPNLTITAYNSNYGNATFQQKKTTKNGFLESGIRMNQLIASNEKWTLDELKERETLLQQKAIEIWPCPESTFLKPKNLENWVSLDEDIDWNNKKIKKYKLWDIDYSGGKWIDVLKEILRALFKKNPSVLVKAASSDTAELSAYFSYEKSRLRQPHKFDEDSKIFFEGNTSTNSKIDLLRKLFELYGENPEDLKFNF